MITNSEADGVVGRNNVPVAQWDLAVEKGCQKTLLRERHMCARVSSARYLDICICYCHFLATFYSLFRSSFDITSCTWERCPSSKLPSYPELCSIPLTTRFSIIVCFLVSIPSLCVKCLGSETSDSRTL